MFPRTFGIADALASLRPTSSWSMAGDEYSHINWMDPDNQVPTEEEVTAEVTRLNTEHAIKFTKYEAKRLISLSDWAMLSDVNISNKAEFEAYRATLRGLILQPVVNPEWPVEPEPVWV